MKRTSQSLASGDHMGVPIYTTFSFSLFTLIFLWSLRDKPMTPPCGFETFTLNYTIFLFLFSLNACPFLLLGFCLYPHGADPYEKKAYKSRGLLGQKVYCKFAISMVLGLAMTYHM